MSTLAEVNKAQKSAEKSRNKLREGARLGSSSLIGGLGGGIVSGLIEAKYPTFLGTSVRTGGVLGTVLVATALIGWLEEYSDEAAALGAGLIAATVSREAEQFFLAHAAS
jgi:hypothetical protein